MYVQKDMNLGVQIVGRPRRYAKSATTAEVAKTALPSKSCKQTPVKSMGLPKIRPTILKVRSI